ncbi:hypothetical protein LIER_16074 [Lithospermum erythrorhizon]|uniref:U1 small nuclear ribonucleoprotein C n=1 Tax=Lithospermum erythrorhizon TaxID=34254 RepID=A0AAV3QAK3_LITER
MPRYYCDYCDTYLTHDSPSVRKQHNAGYKHKANVRTYYQQYEAQLNQSLIDQKVKEHLAFRPPPFAPMRPGPPIMHAPMQIPGGAQLPPGMQLLPGMRPPLLPRPLPGPPGYGSAPPMPQMIAPPGAPMPGQMNGLQRPPGAPGLVPGSSGMPMPNSGPPTGMISTTGAPPMFAPPMYSGNVAAPINGSSDSSTMNGGNAQGSETSH